jgi:hypothetical protein
MCTRLPPIVKYNLQQLPISKYFVVGGRYKTERFVPIHDFAFSLLHSERRYNCFGTSKRGKIWTGVEHVLLKRTTNVFSQTYCYSEKKLLKEEFEDTKGVIRIRKSMKNRQHNDQKKKGRKDKQRSTKHNT